MTTRSHAQTCIRSVPQEPVAVQEEEVEETATPVKALENLGIQSGDIRRLIEAGYHTVDILTMTSKRHLSKVKGMSEMKCEKIMEAAGKLCSRRIDFQTAADYKVVRQERVKHITTGSKELDRILGGGVETGSITMVYGENRCGKSQLALTLCVAGFMPEAIGGAEGKAIYIDTEGSFRPERVQIIAERFGLEPKFILEHVMFARVYTTDRLEESLIAAGAMLATEPFAVLVIDSLIQPFRVEYSGRGELAERQQRMNLILAQLKKIADEHQVAVFVTNQVTADPGASMFIAAQTKAVGGNILAHACDHILCLRKGKGDQRIAKIIDSPCLPEEEAIFSIGSGGVTEPTE